MANENVPDPLIDRMLRDLSRLLPEDAVPYVLITQSFHSVMAQGKKDVSTAHRIFLGTGDSFEAPTLQAAFEKAKASLNG